jgi:hypothetical protein
VSATLETAGDGPVLLTNLGRDDIAALAEPLAARTAVMGYWSSLGYWALLGVPLPALPTVWRERRATPLGDARRSGMRQAITARRGTGRSAA